MLSVLSALVDKFNTAQLALVAAVLVFLFAGIVFVVLRAVQHKLNALWGFLAVLFSAAALLAALIGSAFGTVYTVRTGNPQQTADDFLSAVCSGNYEAAYGLLGEYSSLGLENTPSGQIAAELMAAEAASRSYTLQGDCTVNGAEASQTVAFTYLDLTALTEDVRAATEEALQTIVDSRSNDELYDEEGKYLPAVTDEAYTMAVQAVLTDAARYYTTVPLELSVRYTNGSWRVFPDAALLKALAGGIGY